MSRGREQHLQLKLQASASARRGRWFDEEPPTTTTTAPAPGQGHAGWWACRACAAVAIADCVALGCCPCALVSLLGLALVRAPLSVGRRCVARLRTRRPCVLRRKRVRDVVVAAPAPAIASSKPAAETPAPGAVAVSVAAASAPAETGQAEAAAELAWLDEMYPVAHWGFGRLSFSPGELRKTP